MIRKNYYFILILLLFLNGLYSQSQNIIVDSGANFVSNIDYNIGEIFVVFNRNTILKKTNPNDLTETSVIENVFIYPNPFFNILFFKAFENAIINSITLYTSDGRKLFDRALQIMKLNCQIYLLVFIY